MGSIGDTHFTDAAAEVADWLHRELGLPDDVRVEHDVTPMRWPEVEAERPEGDACPCPCVVAWRIRHGNRDT